ncbi:MAG: 50S ribosomal protein L23 [Chloroflexota bacterium]
MPLLEVLRRPIITEKTTTLAGEGNKYVFEVHPEANKLQIKEAVERAFNVEVAAVNTMWVKGKVRRVGRSRGRTSPWKKAVVTLKPGHRIDLFEGV